MEIEVFCLKNNSLNSQIEQVRKFQKQKDLFRQALFPG